MRQEGIRHDGDSKLNVAYDALMDRCVYGERGSADWKAARHWLDAVEVEMQRRREESIRRPRPMTHDPDFVAIVHEAMNRYPITRARLAEDDGA